MLAALLPAAALEAAVLARRTTLTAAQSEHMPRGVGCAAADSDELSSSSSLSSLSPLPPRLRPLFGGKHRIHGSDLASSSWSPIMCRVELEEEYDARVPATAADAAARAVA